MDFDFSDLLVLFDRVPLSLTGRGFWSRKPLKFDYGFLKGTRVQIAQIGGMLSLLVYGDVVRGARDASITEQLSQLLANKSNIGRMHLHRKICSFQHVIVDF